MDSEFSEYLRAIEHSIAISLPWPPNAEWQKVAFGKLEPAIQADHVQPLIAPTRSLVDLGGKRWRPLLLVLCAAAQAHKAGGAPASLLQQAYRLAPLVEFIHTASLIHDDIEDSSDMRRGKPAAHLEYGLDTALNAASWLYFEAPVCIDTLEAPSHIKQRLYVLYTKEIRRLHLGQAMDIAWHRAPDVFPSVEEYLAMVKCKTGTLASLAAQAGLLLGGADDADAEEAGDIAAEIGAGFQIIDDVINLRTGNPGKKRGDDIVEGKKSLPVLFFKEKYGLQSEQMESLGSCMRQAHQEGIVSPSVERAIGLLEESGAIGEAAARGAAYITGGCKKLRWLFGERNTPAEHIVNLFTAMIPLPQGECHA